MSDGVIQSLRNLFSPSDEQVMWRWQHNADSEAFAILMDRWRGRIHGLCSRMTGDSHRAEDLTQETFLKLFSQRHQYRAEGKFSSFLWRIALNLCHDEARRNRRRSEISLESEDPEPSGLLDQLAADTETACDQAEERETADIVSRALRRLPEHYRSVVILKHYHDLKIREIAVVLNIPEGTVKSRLSEGLQQLGRCLVSQLCDLPTGPTSSSRPRNKEELLIL